MEDENLDELRSSWDRHPLTLHTAKLLETQLEVALHELKGACAESSDPGVSAAYARYAALGENLQFFKHQRARGGR